MAKTNSLKFAPYIEGNLQEYIREGAYPVKFGFAKPLRDADGGFLYEEPTERGYRRFKYEYIEGEWRENEPFRKFLTYDTWFKGRSSVRIIWKDDEGHTYPMFISDFDTLMHGGKIGTCFSNKGPERTGTSVFALWHVVKKGANYGLAWVNND